MRELNKSGVIDLRQIFLTVVCWREFRLASHMHCSFKSFRGTEGVSDITNFKRIMLEVMLAIYKIICTNHKIVLQVINFVKRPIWSQF